ncbi:MAG: phosphoenolpyruvate carboxylase [Bacteroidetes bacterium]|nr:phosphoenolpyruvate carboxylase [Bacteroidota bacterium]MBS1930253.1 phosphoenolpyruvate carboxylase [Bacteroidota bacterium]
MNDKYNIPLQQFRDEVVTKFQLYNSLFTSLPFHRIEKTGILLSLLFNNCDEGYIKKLSPVEIIEEFFSKHTAYKKENEKNDLLFRFVQYVERQVVLFDALEDAAFKKVNDMNGIGTLKYLESEVSENKKEREFAEKIKNFAIRLVLTAHPTQFYPGSVLGIINDLSKALSENNTSKINTYLQQLGKTPFFKKKMPTPFDEAVSLIWYLENVFYPAAGKIVSSLKSQFPDSVSEHNPVIKMGFWPGGDRDGNPFVTSETTLQVAEALRSSIIKCYYLEVRKLKRRLTFEGVDVLLTELETKLYKILFIPGYKTNLHKSEVLQPLLEIKDIIIHRHNGLFLHLVNNLVNKIEIFGLYFASLDVRQVSTVHEKIFEALAESQKNLLPDYNKLNEDEKINMLVKLTGTVNSEIFTDPVHKDTLNTIQAIRFIQVQNGEAGCNRYIISHCRNALNIMEVYALFLLGGWKKEAINIDIVPLFESIEDLQNAAGIMEKLFTNPVYIEHLKRLGNKQTIMLGFSDGTKDGGYLMGNWSIYRAKEELTKVSRKYGIRAIFFDGRGGPPARGGGKTHKFYASMGKNISNINIELTVQGQTVSSNFGTIDAAQFNMEQLLNAGISNDLFAPDNVTFDESEEKLMTELSQAGYQAYQVLRDHPYLTDYLLQVSPLRFYSDTNIGSRPVARGTSGSLTLKSLRAIPFASSWSQLKQNVPGYFGVGSALQQMEKQGKLPQLQKMYQQSLFFKTLFDNCEMAMMKSFFPLTAYILNHKQFGEIWKLIFEEFELTKKYLYKITGHSELMADYPVEHLSIQMREKIVLPLLTIQQYALTKIREIDEAMVQTPDKKIYEKLAMRCSFGIINAGRNSA